MQLIGMLDSPYVRRVAISLQLLELPFEHRPISVLRQVDQFQSINPVVKVPTLVCDDGAVMMDSSLILDHAESIARPGLSLMPSDPITRRDALCRLGLALAACEKSVQLIYEGIMRPPEKRHEAWVARITGQLQHALRLLDEAVARHPLAAGARLDQAALTAAVTWTFVHSMLPELASPGAHPALHGLTLQAEQRPEFKAAPHSEATYPVRG
jgi:glutathione S-transferase